MKPDRLVMVIMIIFFSSCAGTNFDKNKTYIVHEKTKECEGSTLGIAEQIKAMKEVTTNMGGDCIARPVELSDKNMLYRVICHTPQGELPMSMSITQNKKACELANSTIAANPQIGLEKQAQEKQEDSFWLVGMKDNTCFHSPITVDQFVSEMQNQTGQLCRVMLEEFPVGTMRTVICGDNATGTAWVLTDSENFCQDFLKAHFNQPSGQPSSHETRLQNI